MPQSSISLLVSSIFILFSLRCQNLRQWEDFITLWRQISVTVTPWGGSEETTFKGTEDGNETYTRVLPCRTTGGLVCHAYLTVVANSAFWARVAVLLQQVQCAGPYYRETCQNPPFV